MAGAPGLQEIERLGAAHFADGDAVRPEAKRGTHEIGKRGGAVLGAQRHEVLRRALQLAGILDQHHAVAGLGDLGEERIDQGGLPRRSAAGDENVFRSLTATLSSSACATDMTPAST